MKKVVSFITALFLVLSLVGCQDKVAVKTKNMILNIGETEAIELVNMVSNDVIFFSDNSSVAAVDIFGVVKGVSPGSTTIVVIKGKSTWSVFVKVEGTVIEIDFYDDYLDVLEGKSVKLEVLTNDPLGLRFESSDENVLTVDEEGNLLGIKTGSVEVIVYSKTNPFIYNAILVNVLKGIYITADPDLSLVVGDQEILVYQTNETYGISFKSSNDKIVKVDNTGKVEAVSHGVATITITSQTDKNVKTDILVTVISIEEATFQDIIDNTVGLTNYTLKITIGELVDESSQVHYIYIRYDDKKTQFSANHIQEYYVVEDDKQYIYYQTEAGFVKEEATGDLSGYLLYENFKYSDFNYNFTTKEYSLTNNNALQDFVSLFDEEGIALNFKMRFANEYINDLSFDLGYLDYYVSFHIEIIDIGTTEVVLPVISGGDLDV